MDDLRLHGILGGGKNPLKSWKNPTSVSGVSSIVLNTPSETLSVSGRGWIIAVIAGRGSAAYRITVDGKVKIGSMAMAKHLLQRSADTLLIRFENSFKIEEAQNFYDRLDVVYCLGDDFEKSKIKFFSSYLTATNLPAAQEVVGKGWIYGFLMGNEYGSMTIQMLVDGDVVVGKSIVYGSIPFLIRFEQGFTLNLNTYYGNVSYTLD